MSLGLELSLTVVFEHTKSKRKPKEDSKFLQQIE